MNYLEKVYVSDHSLKGCTYNQYFSYYFLSEIKTERGIIKFAVKEVDNITKEEDVYTYNYITKPEDPTLRNFNNFPRGIVYIRLRGSISKVNLVTAILFGGLFVDSEWRAWRLLRKDYEMSIDLCETWTPISEVILEDK